MPQRQIKITIPQIFTTEKKIGKNTVLQLFSRPKQVQFDSYTLNKNLLRLENTTGQSSVLTLDGKVRGVAANENVLQGVSRSINLDTLDEKTPLEWKQLGTATPVLSPDEVVSNWKDKFTFFREDIDSGTPGLREPQVGAIHAVSAHLAVDVSPVTVVMPTGTGKTETMISLLTYHQFRRILILVPTDPLRTQLGEKFTSLGYLPDIGVLPKDIATPSVCMIKNGIQNDSEADKLIQATNVFVATPDILNACALSVVDKICESCDILFVDEAHHITAKTWKAIKDKFVEKSLPVVQFTATPFRNDGGNLEGKIIFNYPLQRAQENGYFKPIRFFPVENHTLNESDKVIAEKALEILRQDLLDGHDHVMMARVQDVKRATSVAAIYRSIQTEWEPIVIHSKMTKKVREDAIKALKSGSSKICICVKMLGEGFDFPNLKVAAIHDVHKSLAVTLQFIGRFTRTARNIGDAAFIANIAEAKVEGELQSLYSQSPDWDTIIKHQSEQTIRREIRHQELLEGFRNQGDLKKIISLWNLRPGFSVMVFKAPNGAVMNPNVLDEVLPKTSKVKSTYNPAEHLFICVAEKDEEVKWGKYKGIKNHNLELLIVRYKPEDNAVFVYSSDYEFFRTEKLVDLMVPGAVGITGQPVFRIFSGVERPMVRNLGARKVGDISFTMHFGANVREVMTAIEVGSSELSNLAGWGYEDGERCTWGCSQRKGKVWSQNGGDILDWMDWTVIVWRKVSDDTLVRNEIISDFLCAEPMTSGRPVSAPISIQWGDSTITTDEDSTTVFIGGDEFRLSEINLVIDEFEETGPIIFSIASETVSAQFRLTHSLGADGGAIFEYEEITNLGVNIKRGSRQPVPFIEYAKSDPLVVAYANGDLTYSQFLIKNPGTIGEFNRNNIQTIDWASTGVNIRVESQGVERNPESIQNRMVQECLTDYDIVFDDDNSGEAADLICIRQDESTHTIEILLVHCKFSSEDAPGARIKDLYEVSGQAQKSIIWKHNGFSKLVDHMKRREERWRLNGHSRFIKGGLTDLAFLKEIARKSKVRLEVWIVQPGVSKSKITQPILLLLGATEEYLAKTSNASLSFFASE